MNLINIPEIEKEIRDIAKDIIYSNNKKQIKSMIPEPKNDNVDWILKLINRIVNELLLEKRAHEIKNIQIRCINDENKTEEKSVMESCVCPKKYHSLLNSGTMGSVYSIEKNKCSHFIDSKKKQKTQSKRKDGEVVVKVEEFTCSSQIDDWEKGLEAGKKSGNIGVGPYIYDSFICKTKSKIYGFIFMEKLEGKTFEEIIEQSLDVDFKRVRALFFKKVDKMHKNGIYHRDIHDGNIMVVFEKNNTMKVKDVFIIDYGVSVQYQDKLSFLKEIEYLHIDNKFKNDDTDDIPKNVLNIMLEKEILKL